MQWFFVLFSVGYMLFTFYPAHLYAQGVPGFDAYQKARASFINMSEQEGRLPRMSDPTSAAILSTLSDTKKILGTGPTDIADLPILFDVCSEKSPLTTYMLHGVDTKITEVTDEKTVSEIVARQTEENIRVFQDEIFPLMAFNIWCTAHTIPAMTAYLKSLPADQVTQSRQHALTQFRISALNVYMGALLVIGDETIKPENRASVLDALAETAPLYAATMKPDKRAPVTVLARDLQRRLPASVHTWLQRVATAIEQTKCGELCAF